MNKAQFSKAFDSLDQLLQSDVSAEELSRKLVDMGFEPVDELYVSGMVEDNDGFSD